MVSRIKVKEVMTTTVIMAAEDTSIEEAARIMADNKVGCLPVVRDQVLVGIITESGLFRALWRPRTRHPALAASTLFQGFDGSDYLRDYQERWPNPGVQHFSGRGYQQLGADLTVADISVDNLLEAVQPLVVAVLDVHAT